MIDYHIHLENGPYTLDWVRQFWEVAQKKGITEIGITEHCHKFREFYPFFAALTGQDGYPFMAEWIEQDFQHNLADYVELLQQARSYGIPLKLGLEVDYIEGATEEIREIINNYPFDYLLGSVHIIDRWGFDYAPEVWEGHDVDKAYHDYYTTLLAVVDSQLFDIVAHIDVIKVFGHKNHKSVVRLIDQVLQRMSENKLCLEISSAGLRKPVNEIYPAPEILKQAAAYKIPITFASDAHYPEHVGFAFDYLIEQASLYGYREYQSFTKRRSSTVKF